MSKDQKKTVEINVEIVDNWSKMLDYMTSTLTFWKMDNVWPVNLCVDGLNKMSNQMFEIIKNKVSSSHIIDK